MVQNRNRKYILRFLIWLKYFFQNTYMYSFFCLECYAKKIFFCWINRLIINFSCGMSLWVCRLTSCLTSGEAFVITVVQGVPDHCEFRINPMFFCEKLFNVNKKLIFAFQNTTFFQLTDNLFRKFLQSKTAEFFINLGISTFKLQAVI